MIAGALEVQLFADVARITRDIEDARRVVQTGLGRINALAETTKRALEGIGVGLSAGALVLFVKHAIDAADQLYKLSQRTGIATEQLSQLQYVAGQADVSHEGLNTAVRKLNVSIAEGRAGDLQKIAAFKSLGITTEDLGKGTVSVMMKMADSYAHAKDGAGKVALSNQLMGKTAEEMIPMLNQGAGGIRAMMLEADRLGLTISGEFAEKAEAFNSNLLRVKASGEKLAIVLGEDLVDGLGKAMKAMAEATVEGGKFHGVMTGLYTLLYGDEQHRANIAVVEQADRILNLQNAIDKARAAGDTATVERRQRLLASYQREYEAAVKIVHNLDDQEESAKKAAAAAKAARENAKELAIQNQAAAEAYASLITRIKEHIAAQDAELKKHGQLTEQQKFEAKVRADVQALLAKFPGLSRAEVDALTRSSAAKAEEIKLERQWRAVLEDSAKFRDQQDQELGEFDARRAEERDRLLKGARDEQQSLKDTGALITLETNGVWLTNAARERSLEDLRIEQQLKKDLLQIDQNLLLTPEGRQLAKDAADANAQLEHQNALLKEAHGNIQALDPMGRQVFGALLHDGTNTFKSIGKTLKTEVIDALYQLVGRQWIIPILAQMTGANIGSAVSAGTSLFGSAGTSAASHSLFSGIGSALAGGYSGAGAAGFAAGGGSFASTVGGGLATDAMGATVAEGAAAATIETGVTGAVSAGLAAIPVVGWIALAGIAAYSLFGGKGGGPKVESGYGIGVPTRGDPSAAKGVNDAIVAQYQSLMTSLGGVAGDLRLGIFSAKDPQGTALTQLAVNAQLNGQDIYSRQGRLGGIENVGRSDAELQAALTEEASRVLLKALQASGLKEGVGAYLSHLGNIDALTSAQLNQAAAQIQAIADKEAQTKNALLAAYQQESVSLTALIELHTGYAATLRKTRDELFLSEQSPLSLAGRTSRARSVFEGTIASAMARNEAAFQDLSGASKDYLDAAKATARTPQEYIAAFAKVQGQLTTAAAFYDSKVTMEQQQLDAERQQLTALGLINASVVAVGDQVNAFTQALADYTNARSTTAAAQLADAASTAAQNAPAAQPATGNKWTVGGGGVVEIGGFAEGGLASGWSIVGELGPELVNFSTPGRVYTREQSAAMFSGGGASDELVAEVRGLREELRQAQAISKSALIQVVAKVLKWDRVGLPLGEDMLADEETT